MKALTPVAAAAAATLPVWMGMNISSGAREREKEREREREEGNGGGRLKEEWEKNERVETGVMERNSLRAIGTSEDKEGTNADGEEKESERKAGEDRARWRVGELR